MKECLQTQLERQRVILKKIQLDRENKTLVVAGQKYKYNAFSILGNTIKIYNSDDYGEKILPLN